MATDRKLERAIRHWQSVTPEFLGLLPKAPAEGRRGIRLGCTFHVKAKAGADRLAARLKAARCVVAVFRSRDKRSWYVLSFEPKFRALTVPSVNDWIRRMAATGAKLKATFRGWSFHRGESTRRLRASAVARVMATNLLEAEL
jgi:hypothetical protein